MGVWLIDGECAVPHIDSVSALRPSLLLLLLAMLWQAPVSMAGFCGSAVAHEGCGACCADVTVSCCDSIEQKSPVPLAPRSMQGGEFRAIAVVVAVLPRVPVRDEVKRPVWTEVRLRQPSLIGLTRTGVWLI
jgi:hypothetical protein